MERVIKFRAWDTEAKVMSGDFSLFGEFTLMAAVHDWQMEIRNIDTVFENGDSPNLIEMLGELKVMQFSGLRDKNDTGVELYEGDVVYLAGYGDYVCQFPFIQLYEALLGGDIGERKGNIYENPYLLQ